jgi:hypothetical protein
MPGSESSSGSEWRRGIEEKQGRQGVTGLSRERTFRISEVLEMLRTGEISPA